jgi:hypothetical protein
MMGMTLGKTCWNNEGGYHSVVSQTEIEFLYKKLNTFRTTSTSSGVHFFTTDDALVVSYLSLWQHLVIATFADWKCFT